MSGALVHYNLLETSGTPCTCALFLCPPNLTAGWSLIVADCTKSPACLDPCAHAVVMSFGGVEEDVKP